MRQNQFRMLFLLLAAALVSLPGYAEEEETQDSEKLDFFYRQVEKSDWNGATYTVKAEDLLTTATSFLTENLMGIVPGVMFRQSQGDLENGSGSYWVRGSRSFSTGALVLIDGMERDLSAISMEEVESITVLKDAAAIGIYGMRACNGAIYIKTKHGSEGRAKVNFAAQAIYQSPTSLYDAADAYGYAYHYNAARRFDGQEPKYSTYDLANYTSGAEGYYDTDWLGEYYDAERILQKYSLNVSGGTKNAKYFVNFGYLHQPGMFNTEQDLGYDTNNNSDRYNYRSNISVDVTKTTHLDVDIYGWYKSQFDPYEDSDSVFGLLTTTPANAFPAYYNYTEGLVDQSGAAITPMGGKLVAQNSDNTNPWAMLNRRGYTHSMTMYGSMSAALTQRLDRIAEGLYAKATFAMDSKTTSSAVRTRTYAYYSPLTEDSYTIVGTDGALSNTVGGKNGNRILNISAQLGYAHSFGRNNVSAATSYEQYESTVSTGVPTRIQGIYGYASWNYDHRFGVDFTGAYQGWYGFAKGHKFGFFPTVSAGWTVSNEDFLKDSKAVNYLKLRASYGHIGSFRGVDAFTYKGYLSSATGVYVVGATANQKLAGYYEGQIANDGLTWEKSRQANIGFDARFVGDRLSISADAFRDQRTDIYTENNRVSTLIGLNASTTVNSNIGAMTSAGYEVAAYWKDKCGDFGYTIGGTLTYSSNVVDANGNADEVYDYLSAIGYPYGRKLGYKAEGLFQSYEEIAAHATQSWSTVAPGDIKYKDVNGDGIIDSNDRVPIGYSNIPEYYYGIQLGVSWKGLGLSALFQGAAHVSHTMSESDFQPFVSYGTIYEHQLDYWTPENSGAKYPRTTLGVSSGNNTVASSLFVEDCDYLRLKRVELTYSLPKQLLEKTRIVSGATIYLAGYNLFTWTDYAYGDPEYSSGGSTMPINRNISLGCRVSF